MTLHEYPDRELMMFALADRLAGEIADFLRREEQVSLAVPGGTTPGPVFDVIAGVDLDWARTSIMLTDERWVPDSHPRSNTALVRRRLLTGRAAAARYIPLWAPAERPEDVLATLSEGVAAALPLSVALVGMGADMHVASLFPGAEGLAWALAADAPPLAVLRGPDLAEPRVSLTARVLRGAVRLHILITGADKRAALDRARGLGAEEAPVRALLDAATVHWAE
ncbi:MAG: 6-phosphogluconolactonase [Rhodobacteraceae bacterium]|nr:6-phosphogluconolactonase [Paracoccaceae bacterium]